MQSSIKAFFAFFLSRKKEVVGQSGLEPPTSRLSVVCSNQLSYWPIQISPGNSSRSIPSLAASAAGGDEEDRTPDPLLARQVLSQLSYTPI